MLGDQRVRAITICVDYADILALTAPWNRFFYDELLVVTSKDDTKTIELCKKLSETLPVTCHRTDVFWAKKAKFNKWAALEEGLDVIGREGWLLIIDADIAIQKTDHPFVPKIGCIYTPIRYVKQNIVGMTQIPDQKVWGKYHPLRLREEFNGYFHLFHASDPILGPPPWHQTNWTWAGGADTFFHRQWPDRMKVRPPFRCLHLGPCFTNWCGRATPYIDGSVDPEAKNRIEQSKILLRARRDRKAGFHGDRYKGERIDSED